MMEYLAHLVEDIETLLDPELDHQWNSLMVDYEHPYVERLWQPYRDGTRVNLHRILPCDPEQALYHRHPWPSGLAIVDGVYEMKVGRWPGLNPAPVACVLRLTSGSCYVMDDPEDWHSVCPVGGPVLSIMVTGEPWSRQQVHPVRKQLGPLSADQRVDLLRDFRDKVVPGWRLPSML